MQTTTGAGQWQIISVHSDGWWGVCRAPTLNSLEEARAYVLANAKAYGYSGLNIQIRNAVQKRRWVVEPRQPQNAGV